MKQKLIIPFLVTIFLLTSCKEKDFEFQVINETGYDIQRFDIDWCQEDNAIAIGAYESSEIFTLSSRLKRLGALCIGVVDYRATPNSIVEYSNNCGISRGREFFSIDKVNIIYIQLNPETPDTTCENNIFQFDYND